MTELAKVKAQFNKLYGDGTVSSFHAPGRVNLIGEHIDYNGGTVFPCALTLGTYGVARKRSDNLLRLASANIGGEPVAVSLDSIVYNKEYGWANYLLGVVVEFQKRGVPLSGLDVLIAGNVSSSAGLSSSASVELLMSVILNTMFDGKLSMVELVKLSQRAENQFVGVNCGIMDQFAVGMGKKDHAMLLNCATLEVQYIPIVLDKHRLVIGNTNSPRGLATSKYNERRAECEKAVELLHAKLDIKLLGDLTPEEFEANKQLITDETIRKRAQHVVYEIQRTKEAVEQLLRGNLEAFGNLMNDSHDSLANLYEVTGFVLDTMVALAREQTGVLGARMTGAGFGGCTVNLVEKEHVDTFIENVGRAYKEKTGITADFYIAGIGDGARQLD
ncbi:MAG: galactokinase [Oscillospiraceae bacterium]|nr:galactokinase [Oscillospiraceae bacterium]